MELGYVYQAAVNVPKSCKVELVGMNDLFQGLFTFFFRSCESFKDSTSQQHTFSSIIFIPYFIFMVHKFLLNCLSQSVLYPNLTRFLVRADLPRIASLNKTPSFLFRLSLALYPRYIDCFQIIKLRTVKLTKHFFFKMVDLLLICALCD